MTAPETSRGPEYPDDRYGHLRKPAIPCMEVGVGRLPDAPCAARPRCGSPGSGVCYADGRVVRPSPWSFGSHGRTGAIAAIRPVGRVDSRGSSLRVTELHLSRPPSGDSHLCNERACVHGSSMRALVVEDDVKIASFVVRGLKQAGYAVDHAPDGETGLALAESTGYDVAIVDVMLPGLDGLSLVRRLRAARRQLPVLFLSARSTVEDRVKGLQAGADDYLTKPFAFSELLARVQALIRRSTNASEPTRLTAGDLQLELLTREVTRGGELIDLQSREFALLEYLMRHAGRVVTKTMILEHIWDYSFDPQTNVIDVLVHRLRAKVDQEKAMIHTLRGVGYVLRPA